MRSPAGGGTSTTRPYQTPGLQITSTRFGTAQRHAAIEASRVDNVGEARHLGAVLAELRKQYYAQQGWILVTRSAASPVS
jgi:hypothetical protein